PVPPTVAPVPPIDTSPGLVQVVPTAVNVTAPVPSVWLAMMALTVLSVPPPLKVTLDWPWNSETDSDGVVATLFVNDHVNPGRMVNVTVPVPVWRTLS